MSQIHWAKAVNGAFTTAADWIGKLVPGSKDDAILNPTGAAFTVTSNTLVTVHSIQTAANATLVIAGSSLATYDGTGTGVNAGKILVGNGAIFKVEKVFANTGSITITGTTATADMLIFSKGANLTGRGKVVLSGAKAHIDGTLGATLNNVDNHISGGGLIGGKMTLINSAAGVITGNATNALTLNTGTIAISNLGLIEADAGGGVVVKSPVNNTGILSTVGGNLTLDAAVTGTGGAKINGGVIDAVSTFAENVTFTGTTGVLELAKSVSYTGAVSGFSHTGGTSFDLRDIAFIGGKTNATFVDNGKHTGGVLTVSDGTHTARIKLVGDYHLSVFTTSSDFQNGTTVIDPMARTALAPTATPKSDLLIAFMAGFGPGASASHVTAEGPRSPREPMLLATHTL